MVSSEESSSCPDELDLGIGLTIGTPSAVGGRNNNNNNIKSSSSSSSSSSSPASSSVTGTRPSPSSSINGIIKSQVVGWPPIRTYRVNSIVNHSKSPAAKELCLNVDNCIGKNIIEDKTNTDNKSNDSVSKKPSMFVKVKMDGIQIGRKVDVNAHSSYETLVHTLDDMFIPTTAGPNVENQVIPGGTRRSLRLLDGSSDFVLTYQDKEGDWMLVGDVPWEMFISSVKRLRIMRIAEANGLASRSHDESMRRSRR